MLVLGSVFDVLCTYSIVLPKPPAMRKKTGCQMLPMLHSRRGGEEICWTKQRAQASKTSKTPMKRAYPCSILIQPHSPLGIFWNGGSSCLLHCWCFLSFLVFENLRFKGLGGKRDKALLGTHLILLANVQSYLFQWTSGDTVGNGRSI